MTVIDEREPLICRPDRAPRRPSTTSNRSVGTRVVGGRPVGAPARNARPGARGPAIAPLRYRGAALRMSRAAHRPKSVSIGVTIALAVLSGLITLWLGVIGHFSGESSASNLPDRLAVVQVQAGETLESVAGRVAPDLPANQVMQRIQELNQLEAGSLEAGQTLISPIS